MYLHIDENPVSPLPTSVKVGSTYNITINIQNICSESRNNVMSNITVTLRSRSGHSRVDTPTRFIPVLTPGPKSLTWKLSGESSGLDVLEFLAIAKNSHNDLTLFDTINHDLEVIPSSTTFYDTTFFVTDIEDIPIANALVRIGSVEIITDVNGKATSSLPQGNYSYFVINFGFQTFDSSFTLKNDLFLNLKLTRIMGEETGVENLPHPFLGSPLFVVFLAFGLGVSGIGLGSLCIHGGNSMRSRFFIVSSVVILTILFTILSYAFGIRIPSPLISILGSTHSLIHWIGWIGAFYLLLFMALSVISKRKAIKLYPKIFRAHVIGNLLATEYVTVHFMQQITRPAENYPILGTGVILYISVIGLALSGYGTAFRFFRSETKKARFLHTSLAITLLLVVIWHIIHGISNPFMA